MNNLPETKKIASCYLNYDEPFATVDSTSTYEPCKHQHGFFATIPKRIVGWREVFCCDDCSEIIDTTTYKKI